MRIRWSFFLAIPFGPLIALAAFLFLFHLQLGVPTLASRWSFELAQKKRAAAQAIKEPKLIIVAGSSGLFGISAEEIHRATGFPTVNFGLHAALGGHYILQMARKEMRAGDTVLLAFEYELYESGNLIADGMNETFLDYVLSRDPEYVRALPMRQYAKLVLSTPGSRIKLGLRNAFGRQSNLAAPAIGVYSSANISPLGDQLGAVRELRPVQYESRIDISHSLASGFSSAAPGFPVIREFCTWARNNGVRVLATFPNVAYKPEYDRPAAQKAPAQIRAFFESMGVPVLGDARESILPVEDFFDTCYHLLQPSSIERTRRLLVHLAPYLKVKPAGRKSGLN